MLIDALDGARAQWRTLKTATITSAWATVDTVLLERLSMTGNDKINLELIERGQATAMERILLIDVGNCEELTLQTWRQCRRQSRATELARAPPRPFL